MTPLVRTHKASLFALFTGVMLLMTVANWHSTEGNVIVSLMPLWVCLTIWIIWVTPVRLTAHVMLWLAMLVDNPLERPGMGKYKSIVWETGKYVYTTLQYSLGLPGVKLSGFELLFFFMLTIMGVRMLVDNKTDGVVNRIPAASIAIKSMLLALGTILAWEVWGIGQHGDVQNSLLQMRVMFYMPLLSLFFAYAFKTTRDLRTVLFSLLTVGVLRALMTIYYHITIMRHLRGETESEGGDGYYVMSHSDASLGAAVLVICIVAIYQMPRFSTYLQAALVIPVTGLGIVFNNRRIAFVAIGMGLFFSYMAGDPQFRRRVHRTVLILLPFIVAYVGAGWSAHGAWAAPVKSLRSVVEADDSSSETRDIENYNLIQTLKRHKYGGFGFGHEYIEYVRAYDISDFFGSYRYVPHNSILWAWTALGLIGYSLYFSFLVVIVFLAVRTYNAAQNNTQRVFMLHTIGAIIAYYAISYGDMGLQGWMGTFIVASGAGGVASHATLTGAWPVKSSVRSSVVELS